MESKILKFERKKKSKENPKKIQIKKIEKKKKKKKKGPEGPFPNWISPGGVLAVLGTQWPIILLIDRNLAERRPVQDDCLKIIKNN